MELPEPNLCGCPRCGGDAARSAALRARRDQADAERALARAEYVRGTEGEDLHLRVVRPEPGWSLADVFRTPAPDDHPLAPPTVEAWCRRAQFDHHWCVEHRDDFPEEAPRCLAFQRADG